MEVFRKAYGDPTGPVHHSTRRILNDREKLEAAGEVIRKMNWYQSPDEWGRIAAIAGMTRTF